MGRNWLCSFTILASALSASAATPSLDPLFKAVEDRYNHAQNLQVFFHEAYTTPAHPKRTESGTLRLHKPGRMRWDYTDPAGKLILADGKFIYIYTPSSTPPQVEKTRMRESDDMRVPLAFLLGKLNFNKDFQDFQPRQADGLTYIAARPKLENLPYNKVEFAISSDYQIRRIQITNFDNSVLDFTFDQEKLNLSLDAKLFRFQMPAGAKLVEDQQ